MKQYLDLLRDILDNGTVKSDRTGTGTQSVFGRTLRFNDISNNFPLVTTKKIHIKSVIHELIWFLTGSTNIKYLQDNGVRIWNEWADEDGDVGPSYGWQWRHWTYDPEPSPDLMKQDDYAKINEEDQIANVIESLKTNPNSRRHIVTAWNPIDVRDTTLPPCHLLFQFNVREEARIKYLDCQMYQRSVDTFLGLPFNIASYAFLTHMIAHVTDMTPGDLSVCLGDTHLYLNHIQQAEEQLTRSPKLSPYLKLVDPPDSIDNFKFENFELSEYHPHPAIKAEISV